MLVGPWKWTTGGVTTYMNNVVSSSLRENHQFVRFNIARPPKRNVIDNYGYGAILRGGMRRLLLGALITLFHVVIFPFVLLMERPNVVQVQASDFQVFWEASLYVWMARALRIPVVMRLGGTLDYFYGVSSRWTRAMIRRVLEWPDRLIVQSNYWRQTVGVLGRTEGVIVLPNSVPDSLVDRRELGNNQTPVCFFAAGLEAVGKGLSELLEAMRLLRTEGAGIRLHIVGANEVVRRECIEAGLGDDVLTDGFLPHDAVIEAMRGAQIFLMPSWREGFPNALVEAMALGLAPVVTPVGAIPEVVEGTGALIVPVKDSRALANAIARLANDAELRRQISAAAREAVKMRYVHSRVMPILGEAWQVLASRPTPVA